MKNIILILLFGLSSVFVFGQSNADVVGEWYNAKEDVIITLFEAGQTVSGKITWMKFPNDENGKSKTDTVNSDEKLRGRARIGMVIMSGFTHIAGKMWDNGSLYDYKKGKTYSGMMTLKDANTLNLRGYIGFSFIGRSSSTWTRTLDRYMPIEKTIGKENLLNQLREDLIKVIGILEVVSLKPAKEIINKIEKEN
jgi:uncharacterized protein (DUF2147 family)